MENKIKYYTPEIEEFHVGFEYEVLQENNNWIKEGINYKPEIVTLPYMYLGNVRVKYLDKEDIEDLGLLYDSDSDSFKKWEKYKMFELVKKENIINISIYQQNKMVNTILPFSTWEEFNIFNGEIKNKSELKKLMKQLNIV